MSKDLSDTNILNPCESDPLIREEIEMSVRLDLASGCRFFIEYEDTESPDFIYDVEIIVDAICKEKRVIKLDP